MELGREFGKSGRWERKEEKERKKDQGAIYVRTNTSK